MIIGSERIRYEKVSSTNTAATLLLNEATPPDGTVITALFQSGGRGQAGNRWESEAGKNLLMSIILYPSMIKPQEQFIISRMVSLAVLDVVNEETRGASVKWPNDIYVSDDKIAGILIEHSVMGEFISGTVAGIGLNVNQVTFVSDAPNPVSLKMLTSVEYDTEEVASRLIAALDRRYAMVRERKDALLADQYHASLYRRGEWHRYSDSGGEFTGMIEGVTPEGLLIIRRKEGQAREYAFKEVDYIL